MNNITDTLRELSVADDALITLSYTEGADVWHIDDNHVEETIGYTKTVSLLAGLLASDVTVSRAYGTPDDILEDMRDEGLLDNYDNEGSFKDYLTGQLTDTIYEGEYPLDYSTQHYDHKRGWCNISTRVKIKAADLYRIDENESSPNSADAVVEGFTVEVQTPAGTLTLS